MDARELDEEQFVALTYHWITEGADEKGRVKVDAQLWRPPPGQPGRGPWSPEAETRAFAALKQQVYQRANVDGTRASGS